jgi:hypothetical protein
MKLWVVRFLLRYACALAMQYSFHDAAHACKRLVAQPAQLSVEPPRSSTSYASVSPTATVETGGLLFAMSILANRCLLFRIADVRSVVQYSIKALRSTLPDGF